MKAISRRVAWPVAIAIAALALTTGALFAHEGRDVEGYNFVVGWVHEPAYEGIANGVEVRVTKAADGSHAGHSGGTGSGSMGHGDAVMLGVEGLQETLAVEVTHLDTNASKTLALYATRGDPGHYTATLIPTAPGVYEFRFRGTVEGVRVDESFLSKGGGGGFDDIRTAADLQFPETLPQIREIESAVRGALDTAQQAQDAALAASEEDGDPVSPLLILAIALGAVGTVSGVGGALLALRR